MENVGFVFTKEDLPEIRDKLLANQKPAAAKAGAMAPKDVFVEPITTTLGPEKTSFFQVTRNRISPIFRWIALESLPCRVVSFPLSCVSNAFLGYSLSPDFSFHWQSTNYH